MVDPASNLNENCHPIYHISPLTLQELASMKVALCIWLDNFRQGCTDSNVFSCDFYGEQVCQRISTSVKTIDNLPPKFVQMVDFFIDSVYNEIKSWYKSWNKTLHLDNIDNCNRFDLVVFGGNGTVHVQDTIAKFLEGDFLSDRRKFEIACKRCMEEKVDSIWPLVREKFSLKSMKLDNNPMLYYWICREKDELNRIPLKDFDCIEHLMIAKCIDSRDYFAVEYFLNLLDPLDRLDQIDQMLQYRQGFESVPYLLPHLEAHIQHYVLGKRPFSIFRRFIEGSEHIQYTNQTWLYVRGFFTPEDFYHTVVKKVTVCCLGVLKLAGIWSNTPFHLKEYTLKNHLSDVLNDVLKQYPQLTYNFNSDSGILLTIISDADVSLRHQYWEQNWEILMEKFPRSQFEELLATCIVNPEAILKFKESLTGRKAFRKYCSALMTQGCYTELDDILNNLHINREQIVQFKKKLLKSKSAFFFGSGTSAENRMEKHAKYIDTVFSGEEDLAQDFKETWILSRAVWNKFINCGQIFKIAKSIIPLFVSPNRHAECKNKLLEVFRTEMTNGRIPSNSILEPFLLWCLDDDIQQVDDFLTSLPIDNIFEAGISVELREGLESLYQFRPGPIFGRDGSRVNQFFKWYFKSTSLFENFKREKIEYYERMDETEVRNRYGKSKRRVIKVLRDGFLMPDDDIMDFQ